MNEAETLIFSELKRQIAEAEAAIQRQDRVIIEQAELIKALGACTLKCVYLPELWDEVKPYFDEFN